MKPDTDEMMSYQNPSIMDKDKTVVPVVVTTITPPTTTTTSIHRSLKWMIVIVAGMMLVTGGVVLMQDGSSYYHSSGSLKPQDGGITTAVVVGTQGKKTAMTTPTTTTTTTPTPTLQTFIAQYPELMDRSPKEQDFQYQAYLLYLTGMTLEELDAYYNAYYNINGSQQDDGGPGAMSLFGFLCCKDSGTSTGCWIEEGDGGGYGGFGGKGSKGGGRGRRQLGGSKGGSGTCHAYAGNQCRSIFGRCCRSSPDNRVGRRRFAFIGSCRL